MAVVQNYLPGDPLLIDKIVYELKSQGIFDQFRKECIADVDTKPAYQNLRQRVEGSVSGFLSKQRWSPDMNKNQLREMLRKNIYESGFLETGVERIVDQVVNPKMNSIFLPKVTEVVYKFLGIEKPSDDMHDNQELSFGDDNLLPTDLEAVSPESEKRFDISNDSLTLNDSKIDEDESPPFEPLEEKPVYNMPPEENSIDSHLSGFSGLMSHDSNHSQELSKPIQMEISNQDSTFSKQSSEGRLSIVMSDDNDTKMEICDDSLQAKPKQKPFDLDVTNNTSSRKSEGKTEEKSRNDKNEKSSGKSHHDKHRSRNDSKSDRDKDRKSEKERKDHKDNKYSSKDKSKERDRKDSKSTSNKSSDKDRNKTSKHRSSSSSKDKDKDKEKSNSSKKESTSSSKDRSDKSKSSSSSKDKDLKHKGDSKGTSSKHDSRSDKHKKDEKYKSERNTSSSNSKNRDKDKKDSKKDKKENKDDHFSSKKRSDRRSTDRDSNDGHSGLKSSSSSFDSYVSSQTQSKGQESSNSNNGSGDSGNSDAVEENVLTEAMINTQTEQIVTTMPSLKLIKPKFASNIHEAKRLMKIRKQLSLLEKQGNLDLSKMISKQIIEKNEKNRITINNQIKRKDINLVSPVRPNREPTPPPPPSPPLKSSVVSAATWDALEAKLHESINYTTGYDDVDGADDVVEELVTYTKDDCRYLNSNSSDKTERFKKFSNEYISNLESRIEKQIPIENTPVKAHPVRNNHTNNVNRSVKRKFTDYNTDVKNNNSNKRFNTHHIEVHENFSLPLSPAESDNSIDKKSDMSDSSDKAMKKTESELVVKKTIRGSSNNQRYSSDDLYKPRPVFGGSRRRNGRNLGVD